MVIVEHNFFHEIFQVCVDLFITTQSYIDIASISVIPRTTGGQVLMNLLLSYLAISTCVILLRVFSYDFIVFSLVYIYIYIFKIFVLSLICKIRLGKHLRIVIIVTLHLCSVFIFWRSCFPQSSRFTIITPSQLSPILQSSTMILDGMSQGPKVLRLWCV